MTLNRRGEPRSTEQEIVDLRLQIRLLQAVVLAAICFAVVAATRQTPAALRAQRLVIVDAKGRDRIVLETSGPSGAPAIHIRGQSGAERVLIGAAPDPVVAGKIYKRIAPSWGMMLYNPQGTERGGMTYLDNGRSVVSLDRANGEGVYMTVNETSGFAGLVGNYESSAAGNYAEAFRLGTRGSRVFAQMTNKDGSPAGAVAGGNSGPALRTDRAE